MSGSLDRIRRILADRGASLRPASEVPPPEPRAPVPPPPEGAARRTARDVLRERLAALRAQALGPSAARSLGPPAEDVAALALPEEDGRTLEERVGGEVRRGPHGSFLQVERRWAVERRHGDVVLARAFERPIPLRSRERRPGGAAAVNPRDAVFLDVETTGLSGGTGTLAFLVGAGRVEGEEFVVRQYFVRDFPDEPAVLDALAEDLGDAPLVTFNGRAFDAPLLSTRFRLHRIPFAERDHLDLLPPARRLWSGSLESHALSEIERFVLGVRRDEDLPGALMPAAYFAWLREARSAGVALAFRHNEVDIVSLAALAGVVSRLLEDPASRPDAPARDHLDTARLLVDHGDLHRARACLEAALARDRGDDAHRRLRRLLGDLCRRAGDLDAAERTWSRWLESDDRFDPHPFVEIAKVLEHRRREYAAALAVVERALARCPPGDHRRADLDHRANRLRRRLACRQPA